MIPFDDVIMDEIYCDYLSKLGSKLILVSKLAPDVFSPIHLMQINFLQFVQGPFVRLNDLM